MNETKTVVTLIAELWSLVCMYLSSTWITLLHITLYYAIVIWHSKTVAPPVLTDNSTGQVPSHYPPCHWTHPRTGRSPESETLHSAWSLWARGYLWTDGSDTDPVLTINFTPLLSFQYLPCQCVPFLEQLGRHSSKHTTTSVGLSFFNFLTLVPVHIVLIALSQG